MQTSQHQVETHEGAPRKISRAARRRVHAREYRVRRTQKAARAQLPVW
ncbi:hypothetical protein ACGFIF_33095 [Kribbella sp. NPDC049174]